MYHYANEDHGSTVFYTPINCAYPALVYPTVSQLLAYLQWKEANIFIRGTIHQVLFRSCTRSKALELFATFFEYGLTLNN